MGFLYGRTGRLTAENGGFRPGQYLSTLHVPRFKDAIEPELMRAILVMMKEKSVQDGGLTLLKLAAQIFHFTAHAVAQLLVTVSADKRLEAACALFPQIVDPVNILRTTFSIRPGPPGAVERP
jgi:hypothetical protein